MADNLVVVSKIKKVVKEAGFRTGMDYINSLSSKVESIVKESIEKVKAAGKDKSLVFPDWNRPTREDRVLVYDKGAYVLHLLREQMGERAFWNGIKLFTRRHFGKSVITSDFVAAMEEANGKSLKEFFAKWVYLQS